MTRMTGPVAGPLVSTRLRCSPRSDKVSAARQQRTDSTTGLVL